MKHGGVTDHDGLIDVFACDPALGIELAEDAIHALQHGLPELAQGSRARHGVADSGDHVRAEWRLAVEGGADGFGHSGSQVHQGAHHGGGPQVEGHPVAHLPGVAGLDRDQLITAQDRSHLEIRRAQDGGKARQHLEVRLHVVAFRGEGIAQAFQVAPLVLKAGFGQLYVGLADVGVQQHQPVDAHGGRLRNAQ